MTHQTRNSRKTVDSEHRDHLMCSVSHKILLFRRPNDITKQTELSTYSHDVPLLLVNVANVIAIESN